MLLYLQKSLEVVVDLLWHSIVFRRSCIHISSREQQVVLTDIPDMQEYYFKLDHDCLLPGFVSSLFTESNIGCITVYSMGVQTWSYLSLDSTNFVQWRQMFSE